MISLIVPPNQQLSKISHKLDYEHGAASLIKTNQNKLSVLDAITSVQEKLKYYPQGIGITIPIQIPEFCWLFIFIYIILVSPINGLAIYCGTVVTEEGKREKVNVDFEPFKPINTALYLCDNRVWNI